MKNKVPVEEAQNILLGLKAEPKTQTIPITEALGRVCATDFFTKIAMPPFDRSPFDGYAFRAEDTVKADKEHPVTLKINQEIPAGEAPKLEICSGYAAKILTGAPIPKGANAIIKYEDTEFTDTEVKIFKKIKPGTDIVSEGEDLAKGVKIIEKGTVITYAMLGMFASQAETEISVFRKPVITVINTGSELVSPGNPLPPGKIYNSSIYNLQGFISELGAIFKDGGIVADEKDAIKAKIREHLTSSDIIITTGGASVGDYDFALKAAEGDDGDILFWKTAMKPGGAMLAYLLEGKLIFALAGNPGSAIIGLLRIGLPYIRKLCGRNDFFLDECEVFLKHDFNKTSERTRILRGHLEINKGTSFFVESGPQGGGDISSLISCDMICEIPAGSTPLSAGTLVKAYRL